MIYTIKKIIFLPNRSKLMALKVLLLLHKFWFLSYIFSFKYLSKRIGKQDIEVKSRISAKEKSYLVFILKIFKGIDKYWLYKFKCLIQVLAASQLLREKQIPYTLFLGVKKEEKSLKAHAWLKSDKIFVTGSKQDNFKIVSFFSFLPSGKYF